MSQNIVCYLVYYGKIYFTTYCKLYVCLSLSECLCLFNMYIWLTECLVMFVYILFWLLLSDWLHLIIVQRLFCEWTNKVDFVFYINDSKFLVLISTLIPLLRISIFCHFGSTSFVLPIRPKDGILNRCIRVNVIIQNVPVLDCVLIGISLFL